MSDWKEEVRAGLEAAGIEGPDREAARIVEVAAQGEHPEQLARAMVERRLRGVPLEYAVGRVRFMGTDMLAEEGALVPRAETEILGRGSESRIRAFDVEGELRIIDMCCGAGNLACALALAFPQARVWASDLTDGCVNVARKNVAFLGLADRVSVYQGDLFAGFDGLGLEGTIHGLVCNPPYISTGRLDKDRAHLLNHEPVEAFDGGPYGLTIHQRVIKEGLPFLRPGGLLSFEFGAGQERQIELLFRRAKQYDGVEFDSDADGNPRAAFTRKKGE
jgi:release factor glutamine methyltransferase